MPTIVYYVSGHGFGHARRTAEVLRHLATLREDVRVVVRTSAPGFIFRNIPNVSVSAPSHPIDPGVVERDPLRIDAPASLDRLERFLGEREQAVAAEVDFIRSTAPDLIVSDIAFLAGDIGRSAGVPSVAVGNFTWDWIYDPFARTDRHRALIERVRESYREFDLLLHLPLGHEATCFGRVVEVSLVASQSRLDRAEVKERLGIAPDDPRRRILIAMRGGLAEEILIRAAGESPDLLFFLPAPLAGRGPENLRSVDANTGALDFTDVLSISDVVVSKIGYGILADSIAAGTAILYPAREGFREDEISLEVAPRYLRMRELSRGQFESGDWRDGLLGLMSQSPSRENLPVNGASEVARGLLDRL